MTCIGVRYDAFNQRINKDEKPPRSAHNKHNDFWTLSLSLSPFYLFLPSFLFSFLPFLSVVGLVSIMEEEDMNYQQQQQQNNRPPDDGHRGTSSSRSCTCTAPPSIFFFVVVLVYSIWCFSENVVPSSTKRSGNILLTKDGSSSPHSLIS